MSLFNSRDDSAGDDDASGKVNHRNVPLSSESNVYSLSRRKSLFRLAGGSLLGVWSNLYLRNESSENVANASVSAKAEVTAVVSSEVVASGSTPSPSPAPYKSSPPSVASTPSPKSNDKILLENPGDVKNCPDFATYQEAKEWFDKYYYLHGDVAQLDKNNNGIPCESLPGAPSLKKVK